MLLLLHRHLPEGFGLDWHPGGSAVLSGYYNWETGPRRLEKSKKNTIEINPLGL